MSKYYALWGERSGTYLTSGGKVIIHNNPVDLKLLFPWTPIVQFKGRPHPDDTIALQFVRGMEGVTFPVRKEDLR
jgi:hypothetical protein